MPPASAYLACHRRSGPRTHTTNQRPAARSESAQGADILTAVLEAVHLRKLIGERRGLPPSASAAAGSQAAPAGATASLQTALAAPAQAPAAAGPAAREEPRGRNRRRGGPPPPPPPPVYMPEPMLGLAAEELGSLVLQARQLAQRDGPEFIEQLKAAGWKVGGREPQRAHAASLCGHALPFTRQLPACLARRCSFLRAAQAFPAEHQGEGGVRAADERRGRRREQQGQEDGVTGFASSGAPSSAPLVRSVA